MINKLTSILITKNEEANIKRCLASIKDISDEIIIVDSGSTDKTLQIAKSFNAKIINKGFDNFASQRNFALSKAENDWVLSLDADEEISQELREEISKAIEAEEFDGYLIPRKNIIFGKEIKHTRWSPDKHIWLFKKSKSKFINSIHEEVAVDGHVGELKNPKIHYSHKNIHEFIKKINLYTDLEALKRDAHDILMRWYGTTLSEVRVTSMLHHLFDACLARHVSLPVDMILLGKALVTVEATCAQLDPDFDFVSIAKPYLTQFLKQKIKKSVQPQHLLKEALQLKDTLKAVPREMLSVLDTIQKGKLNVAVAKEEVTHLTQEMDRSSNRLAFSMIIASLIVGGALLMQTDIEPYLWGMPLFALLCFSGASIISLFLILSIFKEGRWSKLR